MVYRVLLIVLNLMVLSFSAQDIQKYRPVKAEPVGGQEQIEQALQTQFELPKILLSQGVNETVTMYFLVDSIGSPHKISFDKPTYDKKLKKELVRLIKLLKYNRTFPDPELPYYITYSISDDKYKNFVKQKSRLKIISKLPIDSSLVIYSRADKSPVFYKNADEGLTQFLLDELEYPKVGIEKSIEGTVIVEFIVEPNGYVTNIVPKQKVAAGCTEEAIRLMKKTKWQPAELNKKLVRYKMTYPITFNLRNKNSSSHTAESIGQ